MRNSIVDQHCPLRKIKVGEEKSPREKQMIANYAGQKHQPSYIREKIHPGNF